MTQSSREPALSRVGFDRAALRRTDEAWLAGAWKRGRVLLVAPDQRVAFDDTGAGPRLRLAGSDEVPDAALRIFLGERDGVPYFAALDTEPPADPDGGSGARGGLRDIGAELDDLGTGLLTAAISLANWHRTHTRCPRCGTATEVIKAGWSRLCPNDGSEHFPRTDPAVIMLVHDGGDRCVLGRQPSWPEGRFSVLAGFVEAGESAEAAVAREVDEEVGITVRDIRYAASQPWPFPGSLMLGFTARVDGPSELELQDGELAEAHWYSREQIRRRDGDLRLPPPVSIAYRLITDWLESG